MFKLRRSLAVLLIVAGGQAAAGEPPPPASSEQCTRYVPAIDKTVTVPCDNEKSSSPSEPTDAPSTTPEPTDAADPAPSTPPAPTDDAAAPPPSAEVEGAVTFDGFAPGPLGEQALASQGISKLLGSAPTGVYKAEANMVLPPGRRHVLLIAGGPETSLWITFQTPIRRFSVTRIGTAGGASVPTWTMSAFDANGAKIASTGEEHGLPAAPREFTTEANGIAVVRLKTDNRFGAGTWATWNSLPVAEFRIER